MPKVNDNIAELEKLPLAHLEKCYSLLQTKGTGRWKTYIRINLPELYTPAIARTNMDSLWYAICKKKGTLMSDRASQTFNGAYGDKR